MEVRKKRPLIAQINITPLVDVMLVLLVIFMVTVPLLQQGVHVTLPQVSAQPLTVEHEQVALVIPADGTIQLDGVSVTVSELSDKLMALLAVDPNRRVRVRADKGVPYGKVAEVMAAVQRTGTKRWGLTEPLQGSR